MLQYYYSMVSYVLNTDKECPIGHPWGGDLLDFCELKMWYVKTNLTNPTNASPISHNAPFRTEMDTFLFWMVHCGIWDWCIVGFAQQVILIVLNGELWDMGLVHCGICTAGHLGCVVCNILIYWTQYNETGCAYQMVYVIGSWQCLLIADDNLNADSDAYRPVGSIMEIKFATLVVFESTSSTLCEISRIRIYI